MRSSSEGGVQTDLCFDGLTALPQPSVLVFKLIDFLEGVNREWMSTMMVENSQRLGSGNSTGSKDTEKVR